MNYTTEADLALYLAVQQSDATKVKAALAKRGSVHFRQTQDNGNTSLHAAAISGNVDIFRLLLKAGSFETQKNEKGNTPLHLAAKHGSVRVAAHLVEERHVNINELNSFGSSPLHLAARAGKVDCVQYLLSNDAKTDLHEHYSGGTALHGAAVEGRTTVVQLLISADTAQSFQLVDAEGETALMHGARKGFANVCKILILNSIKEKLHYRLLSAQNNAGETLLHIIAKYGNMNVFQVFMSSINGTDGYPPQGKLTKEEKKELLNKVTTDEKRTAFQYASWFSHQDLAIALANNGASVKLTDRSGRTALHLASEKGNEKLVQQLLTKAKMDVDFRDHEGSTALHKAALFGKLGISKLLVENGGINLDIINNDGRTALYNACLCNREVIANYLVSKGANVNLANTRGDTPLHKVAYNGSASVLLKLIGSGAKINAANRAGKTPLAIATERRKKQCILILSDLESKRAPSPPPKSVTMQYEKDMNISPPGSPKTFRMSPPRSPNTGGANARRRKLLGNSQNGKQKTSVKGSRNKKGKAEKSSSRIFV